MRQRGLWLRYAAACSLQKQQVCRDICIGFAAAQDEARRRRPFMNPGVIEAAPQRLLSIASPISKMPLIDAGDFLLILFCRQIAVSIKNVTSIGRMSLPAATP